MIKYLNNVDPKALDHKLQKALFFVNKASTFDIFVTSGLRTPEHNAEVGGVPNSSHLTGLAVDFQCLDSKTRFWLIYWGYMAGFKRIGLAIDHVHLDLDTSKPNEIAFWDMTEKEMQSLQN